MADKYYSTEEAIELMKAGAIMSSSEGIYDYFIIKGVKSYTAFETALVLCGYYSCANDLFIVQDDELEMIAGNTWYMIRKPEEKQNEN